MCVYSSEIRHLSGEVATYREITNDILIISVLYFITNFQGH